MIVSHGDNDHAGGAQSLMSSQLSLEWRVGGSNTAAGIMRSSIRPWNSDNPADSRIEPIDFVALLRSFLVLQPFKAYFERALNNAAQSSVMPCLAGQRWQRDGVFFKMISPAVDLPRCSFKKSHSKPSSKPKLTAASQSKISENDLSWLLRIYSLSMMSEPSYLDYFSDVAPSAPNDEVKSDRAGHNKPSGTVLLSGDISYKMEYQLLDNAQDLLASDIMLVPHHGSGSSSSSIFLDHVAPQYALLSIGRNNRYGRPNAEVVQRYRDRGITLLRSDELGAVQFIYRGQRWHGPYCARRSNEHFWARVSDTAVCEGSLK